MDTPMHYTAETTNRWLDTDAARRAFRSWAAYRAPIEIRCQAQIALIGWAPNVHSFADTSDWIAVLPFDHPAYRRLVEALYTEWLVSDDEHEQFHRWADPYGHHPDALCGGCWL